MNGSFPWWAAATLVVIANAISAAPAGLVGDFDFYNALRKPPLSPPDWLFAPIWLALNVTSAIALWQIANHSPPGPLRTTFLVSEAIGWVTFAAFTGLYFGLRNLTLAAADTGVGLLAALVSLACAATIAARGGATITPAALIALRVAWLLVATYVSVSVVWLNRGGAP